MIGNYKEGTIIIDKAINGITFANTRTLKSYRDEASGAAHLLVTENSAPKKTIAITKASSRSFRHLYHSTHYVPTGKFWNLHFNTCNKTPSSTNTSKRIRTTRRNMTNTDLEKLNVRVDLEAKKELKMTETRQLTKGKKSPSRLKVTLSLPIINLKYAFNSTNIRWHFSQKHGLSGDSMEHIDFDAFHYFICKKRISRTHRILRILHVLLPTLNNQNKFFVKKTDVHAEQKRPYIICSRVPSTTNWEETFSSPWRKKFAKLIPINPFLRL